MASLKHFQMLACPHEVVIIDVDTFNETNEDPICARCGECVPRHHLIGYRVLD